MGAPGVSVVVATYNRSELLEETLDALDRQTRADVEVVVVDDGSTDATAALLRDRGVRSLRVEHLGPGGARQAGWRAARGPVIAFTDDDCVPSPQWLDELARPIEAGEADFVQGCTLPRPDQLDRLGPWARTQRIEAHNERYPTCNMAYRRDVLERLGGFRAEFAGRRTSGEDADLAWRALGAGFRSAFAPAALVHHAVWPSSYRDFLRDRLRWGMIVQVVRYHPATRRLVYRRYFYRRGHVRTLAGAAIAVVAAAAQPWSVPALGAVAVGVHVARTRGTGEPARRRALVYVQRIVADAFEVAVFVRASVRYRTVLL